MSRWFQNLFCRKNAGRRHPARQWTFRPMLMCLEERLTPATFVVTSAADSGPGTLRACVARAYDGDNIVFDPSLNGQTILLKSEIQLPHGVTIAGNLANGTLQNTISGNFSTRMFEVTQNASPAINYLNLINGYVTGNNGGAVLVDQTCTLNLTADVFNQNTARADSQGNYGNGGAIEDDGIVLGTNCTFTNNVADSQGGAINSTGLGFTQAPVRQLGHHRGPGSIHGHHSHAQQHAVAPLAAPPVSPAVQMQGSTFQGNNGKNGGAISINGNAYFRNCTFGGFGAGQPNTAKNNGGAIYADSVVAPTCKLTVNLSTFSGNQANGGGAIYSSLVTDVETSEFTLNTASQFGGAIAYDILNTANPPAAYNSSLTVNQDTFTSNAAQNGGGGAIDAFASFNSGAVTMSMTNSTFYLNQSSADGGGLFLNLKASGAGTGTATVVNDTFFKNSADDAGGGVQVALGFTGANRAALTSLTVCQNTAVNMGGGLLVSAPAGMLSVNNCIFDSNTVTTPGFNGPLDVESNNALNDGGCNLVGTSNTQFTDPSDILNNNPGLAGALAANNAKPYYPPTLALLPTSVGYEKGFQPLANPGTPIPYCNDGRGRLHQPNKVSIGAEDPDAI